MLVRPNRNTRSGTPSRLAPPKAQISAIPPWTGRRIRKGWRRSARPTKSNRIEQPEFDGGAILPVALRRANVDPRDTWRNLERTLQSHEPVFRDTTSTVSLVDALSSWIGRNLRSPTSMRTLPIVTG